MSEGGQYGAARLASGVVGLELLLELVHAGMGATDEAEYKRGQVDMPGQVAVYADVVVRAPEKKIHEENHKNAEKPAQDSRYDPLHLSLRQRQGL